MPTDPDSAPQTAAQRLWQAVTDEHELGEHEAVLLAEACATLDLIDALQAQVDADGAVVTTATGARVHPAVVELRQQRIVAARLIAALRVPDLDDAERLPRRPGARGVYRPS